MYESDVQVDKTAHLTLPTTTLPQVRTNWSWFIIYTIMLSIGFAESAILSQYFGAPDDGVYFEPDEYVNNYLIYLMHGYVVYFIGYVNTTEYNKLVRLYYWIIFILTIPIFSFALNANFIETISLDTLSIKMWSWRAWLLMVSVSLLITVLIGLHFYVAYKYRCELEKYKSNISYPDDLEVHPKWNRCVDIIKRFTLPLSMIFFISIYVGCYVYLRITLHNQYVEIHHWFIFWFFALFAKYNIWWSVVCQAICLGIFAQGVGAYGPTYIYAG